MLLATFASATERPNILFIFSDDHAHWALGTIGHPIVQTPNLDRLAKGGTVFTNAYNQGGWHGAICVPSRAMLHTGRFVWNAKTDMDRGLEPFTPAEREHYNSQQLPRLLHDSGYETYFTGKWHVDARGGVLSVPVAPLFDHLGTVRMGGMPPVPESTYNRPIEGQEDTWSPHDPQFRGFWIGGTHWAEVLANDAVTMIEQATNSDKPFFIYLSFNSPHDPRQAPKEYVDMYPQERMDVPPNFLPENPFKDAMGTPADLRDERLAPFPRTEYAVRVHRAEYYAMITHMDTQIGRIFDALDASGKRENTIIIYTSDNGLAVGAHGLFGKQSMFEHSVKIPLIIAGPGLPEQKQIDTPVYMQDVMPTMLEIAGREIPAHVQFKSLLPLLSGERTQQYEAIYGAYMPGRQRMVRQGDYKLIVYPVARTVLLFNLKDDPHEITNLAGRPEYIQTIRSLLDELKRLQQETGDPLELDASTLTGVVP